jgi:sulfur carrier protein
MTLTINGSERMFAVGTTLSELLASLALDARLIVVEHNRVILHDRNAFASHTLQHGDVLELVHFVGGG